MTPSPAAIEAAGRCLGDEDLAAHFVPDIRRLAEALDEFSQARIREVSERMADRPELKAAAEFELLLIERVRVLEAAVEGYKEGTLQQLFKDEVHARQAAIIRAERAESGALKAALARLASGETFTVALAGSYGDAHGWEAEAQAMRRYAEDALKGRVGAKEEPENDNRA